MEDKINTLLNEQLAFVNAMLAYVVKSDTATFNKSQIQEIFGFDQIKFRSMRDQVNQCCVHNLSAPGVYMVIVRECVALRNQFVSLQVHEKHTELLSKNNKILEQQMRSDARLLTITKALLILTAVLLILTFFQAFNVFFTRIPRRTKYIYQQQEADKNCENMKAEKNPSKDVSGEAETDNISIPKDNMTIPKH